jgi:glycosyltransferase involved in cell wall biosynthesis
MISKFLDLIIWPFRAVWSVLPETIRRPIRLKLWEARWAYPKLLDQFMPWIQAEAIHARILTQRRQIQNILNDNQPFNHVIVIAPNLPWDIHLFQRPHQLAQEFARQGALVFYTSEDMRADFPPFQRLEKRLYLCNSFLEAFDVIPDLVAYVLTWNVGDLAKINPKAIIYDYIDDITVFRGNYADLQRNHQEMLQQADVVTATAISLFDEIHSLRPDAVLCPNGVDYPRFAAARQRITPPPPDLVPILANNRPIIGYYGALAHWFDYHLLEQTAILRPTYNFVLIGPDLYGTASNQNLFQLPNVYWLGVKLYENLPSYLTYFDVATIPFCINEITQSTSPIKLFEYMAAGKPVVITPMQESLRYPAVLAGDTPENFAIRLDEALSLHADPAYLEMLDTIARQNTWQIRAEQILAALNKKKMQ